MIVLDTNVISELARGSSSAEPVVQDWFARLDPNVTYVASVTLAELWSGLATMPEGRRQRALADAVDRILAEVFGDRVLSFDASAARQYAAIVAYRKKGGLGVKPMDLQIAAVARSRGTAVATRNIRDFERCGIMVLDPWSGS